jgi:hypothetical protein
MPNGRGRGFTPRLCPRFRMNALLSTFRARLALFAIAPALWLACSSPEESGGEGVDAGSEVPCRPGEVLVDDACVPARPVERDAGETDTVTPTEDSGEAADVAEEETDTEAPLDESFTGRFPIDERMVAICEDEAAATTLTGIVHIPAGTLPLPGVTVYVPRDTPGRIRNGASCEACADALSGQPLVWTETEIDGTFVLRNVPHGENVPLVIEVGKWRRMITVPTVERCAATAVDAELTRLPRSRSEGHLPQFAVTTGEYDSLECLLRKIGIDEEEFTTNATDGRVHLFAGRGGTNRFVPSLNGGASFPPATGWWGEVFNLLAYDVILHSCVGSESRSERTVAATEAMRNYTSAGGRVFLSHYHYDWLAYGPEDFRAVADWGQQFSAANDNELGTIDTTFFKGAQLNDWMTHIGAAVDRQFPIRDVRTSMGSFDPTLATSWVTVAPGCAPLFPCEPGREFPQYLTFNTPVRAAPENQCGRVVFSDIHVASGDTSSTSTAFPQGCTTTGFSPQEQAITFMLFDLSRCIVPDKI